MTTYEAVRTVLSAADASNRACFFTNGFISRIAFSLGDRPENFYIIGSMGQVSSVALGAALNSAKKVLAFDGDGSLLMNMGVMPVIGSEEAENLLHIVLDNMCYGSTGGQPTVSGKIDFLSLARSVGYRSVYAFSSIAKLKKMLKPVLTARGPVFLHLKVEEYKKTRFARMPIDPRRLTERMRQVLKK